MNILFVCSRNRLRSLTAEAVFSTYKDVEVLSAGTHKDAENPISLDLVEWADIVFAMEGAHHRRLNRQFGSSLRAKRIIVLGIPDVFTYMDEKLIKLLEEVVPRYLPLQERVASTR